MFQSPFLDANPAYAVLLNSAAPPKSVLADGEYVSLSLYDNRGKVVYESSLRPVSSGFGDFSEVPFSKFDSRPKKAWLTYLRVRDGRRYPVGRRVQWVYPKGSPGRIPKPDYDASVRKARRIAGRRVNPYPGKVQEKSPRSSTVRPNPEIRGKQRQGFIEGNNGGYFFSPSSSSETTYVRTWSGVRTPGFGKLKKEHRPVNPFSVNIMDVQDSGLIEMFDNPSSGIYFNQYSAFTRLYDPPDPPAFNGLATTKAVKKLKEIMHNEIEGNLAQDIVQIRQTVKLITNTAKRIAGAGKALKDGNIPRAIQLIWQNGKRDYGSKRSKGPSASKSAANNWLEMQYGWKPLLEDLIVAFDSVARLQLANAAVHQVAASAQVSDWEVDDLKLPGYGSFQTSGWTRVHTKSRSKIGLRFTVEDHLTAFLAQTGFLSPISLVWEILPFSFVWDWMQPIGPWLDSLNSDAGLVVLDGFQTSYVKQKTESFVRFAGDQGPGFPGLKMRQAGTYGREWVIVNRVKLNTFPVTPFPTFKNPLSVVHATNALALLKSVFAK